MSGGLQRNRRLGLEPLERRELLSTVVAGAARGATVTDDYPNTFSKAALVSLDTTGSGSQSGTIERSGDVDMFKFVAASTGKMTIQESAASGSRLDSYLYVYDSRQRLLARNDDSGRSLDSRVEINVTAGTTYYVKAAAYGRSTGAYTLQLTTADTTATDDYGNTIAQATQVTLSATGSATQSGKIEQSGDVDVFKIVATTTGTMTIQQAASSGSQLDSYLYVYDSSGNLLAESNDNGSSSDSQVQVSVVAGTTYYVKAAGHQTSTGAYTLSFSTAEETTPSEGGFQITATISGMTTAQEAIVEQAIERWEEIIVGDVSDVTYRGRTIDDIEITISAVSIDGSGNVLGQAAATAFRQGSDLPYMGYLQLDTADVADMASDGSLLGVIEHEIAHVLGFGTIWSSLHLLTGSNTSSPGFTGANAVAEYNAIFGTTATSVPVEADGGSGTRLSHWDETVFGSELMTGWYNSGRTNPLSVITVASMADLGYEVNLAAADSYTPATSSVAASTGQTRSSSNASLRSSFACLGAALTALPSNGVSLDAAAVEAGSGPELLAGAGRIDAGLSEACDSVEGPALSSPATPTTSSAEDGKSNTQLLGADESILVSGLSTRPLRAGQTGFRLASATGLDDSGLNTSDRLKAADATFAELGCL